MINQDNNNTENPRRIPLLFGATAILLGALILVGRYLGTGWLFWAAAPIVGAILLLEGTRSHKTGWIIPGSLVVGAGLGVFLIFSNLVELTVTGRIGLLLISFAMGWCLITAATAFTRSKTAFWALIPAEIIASVGLCLLFSDLSFLSFVLYITTGLGLILLGWGVFWKLYGLIIPGSLLSTIGPGVYLAWGTSMAVNPLSKTGLMIGAFSFGWGLIVFFSRVISPKFVWWPLIPGGVLAMAGWGLYIGGDPGNAPEFIANTGSVGLIIFGLYLLLLRKSIHR